MDEIANSEKATAELRVDIQEEGLLVDAPVVRRSLRSIWRNWRRVVLMVVLAAISLIVGAWFGLTHPLSVMGEATVAGRVIGLDGSPLEAQVAIHGTSIRVMADRDGSFRLDRIPSGPQAVVVSYQGYEAGFPASLAPGEELDVGDLPFWPLGE